MNIIELLHFYIRQRAPRARAERFARGFNYAAGALLNGEHPGALVMKLDVNPDTADEFDAGIFAALEKWRDLGNPNG
jgi:hypothetical protein